MKQVYKNIGVGSASILLSIFGLGFCITFADQVSYGDSILRHLGLNPWSNGDTGTHYTIFYSFVFFIPALILGYKFKKDFGAKLGRIIALAFVTLLLITIIFFTPTTIK